MTDKSFRFRPAYARRIPDPNFKNTYNAEKHIFLMPVGKLPSGIGLDPNARNPKIRKRVYQQVEESLLNQDGSEPNTFHLKNKGIVMIAATVQQVGDNEYDVTMQTGVHGIVDGGHTYALIQKNQTDGVLPEHQYV
ncbi:MAG: AIPR family protein, partial [Gemmatimonadetes bacterium]|nr:AIPR family protein [Gemmatimonadota bacterium]